MESFLIYIGKSALAAGAFYLVFMALFQNRKQFVFNRIYLSVSLALSFIIPLITFTTIEYIEPASPFSNGYSFLPETIQPVETTQPQFQLEWYHYLFLIYITGTAAFLFHLLFGHYKAISILKKSRIRKLFNTRVNITEEDVHPFSFFNKIVLSEKTLTHPNLEMIVAHEKIHVNEKHTMDILFTELLFILQWFNPFVWLIKNAVKNNLEYKVDAHIAKTANVKAYQLAMVTLADKKGVAPFLTALNGSQLKNRIIMMKKKTENRFAFLKQLAVLPLLAVLITGLSSKEIKHQNESTATHTEIQKETAVYGKTTKNNNEQPENIIITNMDKQNEPIPDSRDNNKIRPGKENETMFFSEDVDPTQEPDTNFRKNPDAKFNPDNKLYIVDGREYESDINDIDGEEVFLKNQKTTVYIYPRQLQKMKELSKEEAVKKYGNKAKHGAFEIATKTSALTEKDQELNKFLISVEFQQNQLILEGLEGCAFTDLKFSINDNKPVTINQFGMASAGTGNSADDSGFLFEIEKINDQIKLTGKVGTAWKELSYKPAIKKHLISKTGVYRAYNPLIIIDRMITGYKSIDHINPGDIQSVTVLKDEKATERYGVKGKDGIIEITMKPLRIYTELQLRKFIADEVRYPLLAHKSNLEKTVNLSVKIDTEGKISFIPDETLTTDFNLDEIVVVGYKNKDTEVTGYPSKDAAEEAQKVKEQLFVDETKRIINKIPKLDIEKFKGKTVGITVKFMLQ